MAGGLPAQAHPGNVSHIGTPTLPNQSAWRGLTARARQGLSAFIPVLQRKGLFVLSGDGENPQKAISRPQLRPVAGARRACQGNPLAATAPALAKPSAENTGRSSKLRAPRKFTPDHEETQPRLFCRKNATLNNVAAAGAAPAKERSRAPGHRGMRFLGPAGSALHLILEMEVLLVLQGTQESTVSRQYCTQNFENTALN